MKEELKRYEFWLVIILLVSTVATIVVEILVSGKKTTSLETSLFGILQFVFSLSFAWILSRISARRRFKESQKQFAISAYRRIVEIDKGIERLLSRTDSQIESADEENAQELEVIREICRGMQKTIKSSVADWGDIIGEEIEKVERIQSIKEASDDSSGSPDGDLDEKGEEIERLKSGLPPSLRLLVDDYLDSPARRARLLLDREMGKKGFIKVKGFYDPTFERPISEFEEGDKLRVSIDDVGNRIGVLIAHDDSGNPVGVIVNKMSIEGLDYTEYASFITRYLRRSKFDIFIDSIEEEMSGDRHYFTARIPESERGAIMDEETS